MINLMFNATKIVLELNLKAFVIDLRYILFVINNL